MIRGCGIVHIAPMTDSSEATLTVFHGACESGDFYSASVELKSSSVNPSDGWGSRRATPLHWASQHGNLSFVKLLIENHGVDPGSTLLGGHEDTPLHLAAVEGHLDVVKYLVEEGRCHPDTRARGFRRPPITYACGISTIPDYHYSDDDHALAVVQYLFDACGCDPNWRDAFGMTALHNAAINRRLGLVRYLLSECGCDPLERDSMGNTCVHLACSQSAYRPAEAAVAIIRLLIVRFGCDPMATNRNGEQPIDLADEREVYAELVSYGAQGRKAGMYRHPQSFMAHANSR